MHTERETSEGTLSGRLETVDGASLRMLDAVGNIIDFVEVDDAEGVAGLVGDVVTVTGAAVRGSRGRIVGVAAASVVLAVMPMWPTPTLPVLDNLVAPPTTGIDGVDEDEVAAFLALLRR